MSEEHPLDWRRVVVVGSSGAGKTTFSRELAARLGARAIELDALFWDAGWEPRPRARFHDDVRGAAEGERWVCDGNYRLVRDLLWSRATVVVWLNLPFHVVFGRVFMRTLRRVVKREVLWQGNRESLGRTFSRDSILWYLARTFRERRAHFAAKRASGPFRHLRWIELRSARDVTRLLETIQNRVSQTTGVPGAQSLDA